MYTQLSLTHFLLLHETMVRSHMLSARAGRNPSRGRRRRKLAIGVLGSPVLHVSAHTWAHMGEEAGSAGRSRRSLRARRRGRRRASLERECSVEV